MATEGGVLDFVITASNVPIGTTISIGTADGSAVAGTDYSAFNSSWDYDGGTLNFNVNTLDDNGTGEGTQTMTVTASGDGASGTGTGTINEDNEAPALSVSSPSATEGGRLLKAARSPS